MSDLDTVLDLALSGLTIQQIAAAYGKAKAFQVESFRKSGRFQEKYGEVMEEAHRAFVNQAWLELERGRE